MNLMFGSPPHTPSTAIPIPLSWTELTDLHNDLLEMRNEFALKVLPAYAHRTHEYNFNLTSTRDKKHNKHLFKDKLPVKSLVMLKINPRPPKYAYQFEGPYLIVGTDVDGNYTLAEPENDNPIGHHPIEHLKILRIGPESPEPIISEGGEPTSVPVANTTTAPLTNNTSVETNKPNQVVQNTNTNTNNKVATEQTNPTSVQPKPQQAPKVRDVPKKPMNAPFRGSIPLVRLYPNNPTPPVNRVVQQEHQPPHRNYNSILRTDRRAPKRAPGFDHNFH